MKLRVSHLGRLKEAEFDIKPLTVFIGPNHTNKTWTAYSLYGLARKLVFARYLTREGTYKVLPPSDLELRVAKAAQQLLDAITQSPEAEVRARMTRAEVIGDIAPEELIFSCVGRSIATILGIEESDREGVSTRAQLIINPVEFRDSVFSALEIAFQPSSRSLRFSLFNGHDQTQPESFAMPLFGTAGSDSSIEMIRPELMEWITTAFSFLIYTIMGNAVALPAERKALLSMDLPASYEAVEGFASPIPDFLSMIEVARRRRKVAEQGVAPFPRLADVLEDNVLRGRVRFRHVDAGGKADDGSIVQRRRSRGIGTRNLFNYASDGGVELAMHASASIVRSLAGLDIYLREFARRGDLLIIDEPEMNAHPDAQLKIIEFLALLAHHGVRVVITTHSPYIVDHLSNLMQASALTDSAQDEIAPRFKLGMKEAFLSPDQVSTYLFTEAGTVEDILDREQGVIDLSSFSHPTEYMQNLVNEIWKAADSDVSAAREPSNAV